MFPSGQMKYVAGHFVVTIAAVVSMTSIDLSSRTRARITTDDHSLKVVHIGTITTPVGGVSQASAIWACDD